MARISLTDFVDIVSASGTPKATKVRQILEREEYSPAQDFYKALREEIIDIHKNNKHKKEISAVLDAVTDDRKMPHYKKLADAYISWWGRKSLTWFEPENFLYRRHEIEVSINPELGLHINDKAHLIKLYFKASPLGKKKADIITGLMSVCLGKECPPKTLMSVLDISQKKLFVSPGTIERLSGIVNAELAYISSLLQEA